MNTFKEIRISDKEIINEYLESFNTQVSELNFTNLYAWREKYKFEFAIFENFLWILNKTDKGKVYFSPPIGDYSNNIDESINFVKSYCLEHKIDFVIKKASENVKDQILKNRNFKYEVETNRDASDYLYQFDDLLELKGNKYHKKKNRINKFMKTYNDWSYEIIKADNINECRLFANQWCEDNDCNATENLIYERKAIKEVFDHYETLGCNGGIIRVNGIFAGFTISERLNDETVVIHFEKADIKYSGIYNILSNEHLKHLNQEFNYINREQDLGIEGLRHSKLSYHPIRLIEKYKIKII